MKKIIITMLMVIMVALAITPLLGDEDEGPCAEIYVIAEMSMTLRQDNISMKRVIKSVKSADSETKTEKDAESVVIKIIIDAYKTPLYGTKKYKRQAIREFANKWFLRCIENNMSE